MRKLIALTLVLALALGTAGGARAETNYYSRILAGLTSSCSDFIESSGSRAIACAAALICYTEVHPNGAEALSQLSLTGTAKIANWGNYLDIYFPTTSGNYLNLYISPGHGDLTDYGYCGADYPSNRYTYYSVSMTDVTDQLLAILDSD